MKNTKRNSCLADFENELESLNHSEMKELVGGYQSYSTGGGGGIPTMVVTGYQNSSTYGGFGSYSAFASAYGLNSMGSTGASSPGGMGSGGSSSSSSSSSSAPSTPAPLTELEKCQKEYDSILAAIKWQNGAIVNTISDGYARSMMNQALAAAGERLRACTANL